MPGWHSGPLDDEAREEARLEAEKEARAKAAKACPKGHETGVKETSPGAYFCSLCGRRWKVLDPIGAAVDFLRSRARRRP